MTLNCRKRHKKFLRQLITRISQLESMVDNTVIKQKEQLSGERDGKKDILCKFMDSDIFKNIASILLQNDIVSELSKLPPDTPKIIDGSFLNSLPQYF